MCIYAAAQQQGKQRLCLETVEPAGTDQTAAQQIHLATFEAVCMLQNFATSGAGRQHHRHLEHGFFKSIRHFPSHVAAAGVASILALGLACTALAFVLFFALIGEIGPARATVITYVNPAIAVALGLLLLNEQFTVGMGIGFPLILVGSVLAASAGRRRAARAPRPGRVVPPVDEQADDATAVSPAPAPG